MLDEIPHIAIYSRKSKFTGKGESIENQVELCRRYIAAHNGEEAARLALVYEDEGFSGGNLERPQFRKMMADAVKLPFSALVVYRLDRISRNIGDFAKLIEALNEYNISFISIREQFDTSSPMGRAMMYIASVFSQLERETIAERIRDNMHELAKSGRWLGGVTPSGYASEAVEKISLEGKVRKACRLRLIPEEAAIVKRIYAAFLTTRSLSQTERILLREGAITKNGKAFSRFAIKGILTNPVYGIADREMYQYWTEKQVELYAEEEVFNGERGMIVYNRTLQKPGKAHQLKPMGEWIVSVGAHPGLISGLDWRRVQALFEGDRCQSKHKPRNSGALLSGILFCGNCGNPMRPKLTGHCGEAGIRRFSYLCEEKRKSRNQRCKNRNANGNLLDRTILREIQNLPVDGSLFWRSLREEKRSYAVADHDLGVNMSKEAPCELTGAEIAAHLQRLISFPDLIESLSMPQQKEILHSLIQNIVWDGETAQLHFVETEGVAWCKPPISPTLLRVNSKCYSIQRDMEKAMVC